MYPVTCQQGARVYFSVCSGFVSSMGFGVGVVAMVQPIQAPMPRTAMNAMSTGMATSQIRMACRAGQKRAMV